MDNPSWAAIVTPMNMDADVLIVGGGLNGPALALALASAGLSSCVIDAHGKGHGTGETFDGRAYALSLSTRRMLDAIGVWKRVAAHNQPILDIKVTDGKIGEGIAPTFLHFDHRDIEEGPMGHMVEDRYLRSALVETAGANPAITMEFGVDVVGQDIGPSSASVTLSDGRRLAGRLLVGADGRGSGCAQRAGIARTVRSYGQTAMVCALAHEHPHQGVAHQLFLPPGPLAILPLPGNRCSIVWTETDANASAIGGLPDAGYLDVLRPRFGNFLGQISLEGDRFAYPLGLSLANALIGERLALVGDAAHGIHPLAGQGLNLGLRDVAALAEVLCEAHRRGEDIGVEPVLARYRRWRSFDIATLAAATDGLNRVFSNDAPLLRLGRDAALGAVSQTRGLQRWMIREAAGLSGDLPRLLKGLPL